MFAAPVITTVADGVALVGDGKDGGRQNMQRVGMESPPPLQPHQFLP